MAEPRAPSRVPIVAVALVAIAVVWGTQYLVIRVAREETSAELAVVIRFALVAVVGQALILMTRARADAGQWRGRIGIGVCQGLSMLLLYRAERDVESAWASIIMAMSPLFVVLFALPIVPEERVRPRLVAGLVVGFAGAVVIVGPTRDLPHFDALLLLAGAAALAGLAKVLSKRFAPRVPPVVMLRDLGLVVVVVVAPFAALGSMSFTLEGVVAHSYLGLVASAFASGVYFWLLRHLPVTKLAYLPFVSAVVGVGAGYAAGERLSTSAAFGTALVIVGGLLIVTRGGD